MSVSTSKQVPDALQGTWKLTDLDISFVSACPQGANPGAKILLKKEHIPMSTQFAKSDDGKDKPVNVSIDVETLSKAMSDNLKKAVGEMLAKDKNLSAEVITETVVAVVTGDIAKMQSSINEQLIKAVADVQKDIDAKIATAKADSSVEKAMGDEILTLNGATFKKSEVGEHAFQAIKASAIQQESILKELEHQKVTARVEKEFPNVAGKPEDKASLLMLIEKADDSVKTIGLAVLKALNDAGTAFKKESGRASTEDGGAPVGKMASDTDASGKLDQMAKELSAKEGISLSAAYVKVLDTPEGEALYNQHRG